MPPKPAAPETSLRSTPNTLQSPSNSFWDDSAGFGISKPVTWQFLDPNWEQKNRKGVSFGNTTADDEHRADPPALVMIVRDAQEPCTPAVRVRAMPAGDLAGLSDRELAASLIQYMKETVPTFQLAGPPGVAQVAGHSAGHFKASFQVKLVDSGVTCNVFTRVWVVPRGRDIFTIAMSGPSTSADALEATFSGMLQSVSLRDRQ